MVGDRLLTHWLKKLCVWLQRTQVEEDGAYSKGWRLIRKMREPQGMGTG